MRIGAVIVGILAGCGGEGGMLPSPDTLPETTGDLVIGGDHVVDADTAAEDPCRVAWSWKSTATSGGTAHLARTADGLLLVSSRGRLDALGASGKEEWSWPADDDPMSAVEAVDAQLGTPAVGFADRVYVGTSGEAGWREDPGMAPPQVLCLNKGGTGRWSLDVTGPVLVAPTVLRPEPQTARIVLLALTTDGVLSKIHDFGQSTGTSSKVFVDWTLPPDPADVPGRFDPVPGAQVLADERDGVERAAWVLGRTEISLVRWWKTSDQEPEHVEVALSVPLPEGTEATSNGVLTADGVLHLAAGEGFQGTGSYASVRILSLDRDGTWITGETGVSPPLGSTAITGLTEGLGGTWLVGTSNNGVAIVFAATGEILARHFENFTEVAAPVQTADQLVFASSRPHWLHVMGPGGDVLWREDLAEGAGVVDPDMAPSCPLVTPDGTVHVHAGNTVLALLCTAAPPAAVTWPRHGGNDRNSGNLFHSLPEDR